MTKKKKKEGELNPEITESKGELDVSVLQQLAQTMENSEIDVSSDDSASFFRAVLKQFFSPKNISMKTEYLNVHENYTGAKLQFLAKTLDMPYMKDFIEIFETKRVSLERKGRKELLLSIQERNKEVQEQKMSQFRSMFGL